MLKSKDGRRTAGEGDKVGTGRARRFEVAKVIMCDVWEVRRSTMLLSHFRKSRSHGCLHIVTEEVVAESTSRACSVLEKDVDAKRPKCPDDTILYPRPIADICVCYGKC